MKKNISKLFLVSAIVLSVFSLFFFSGATKISAQSAPEPQVTFSASSTSAGSSVAVNSPSSVTITISSGSSITLNWTSTNTFDSSVNPLPCTAAGDWTGKKASSGSQTITSLTDSASFGLYCDGPGGESGASYVSVVISSPNNPNPTPTPTPTPPGGTGLVPCTNNCGWNDFFTLINNVVKFILVYLAVPIAAIMFAYAGGLLMFSGGSEHKRDQAKKIFINVAIGLVFIAASWIIVHTVFSIVGYDGSWIGF
jgi:hypothetical protein